jgi:hypothetical protein
MIPVGAKLVKCKMRTKFFVREKIGRDGGADRQEDGRLAVAHKICADTEKCALAGSSGARSHFGDASASPRRPSPIIPCHSGVSVQTAPVFVQRAVYVQSHDSRLCT